MMELHNPYVYIYRTAKQRLNAEEHIWLCFKTVWITADTIILPHQKSLRTRDSDSDWRRLEFTT